MTAHATTPWTEPGPDDPARRGTNVPAGVRLLHQHGPEGERWLLTQDPDAQNADDHENHENHEHAGHPGVRRAMHEPTVIARSVRLSPPPPEHPGAPPELAAQVEIAMRVAAFLAPAENEADAPAPATLHAHLITHDPSATKTNQETDSVRELCAPRHGGFRTLDLLRIARRFIAAGGRADPPGGPVNQAVEYTLRLSLRYGATPDEAERSDRPGRSGQSLVARRRQPDGCAKPLALINRGHAQRLPHSPDAAAELVRATLQHQADTLARELAPRRTREQRT